MAGLSIAPGAVLVAFLAINGWTMHLFHVDKMRSLKGKPRIPERTLLAFALWGGSVGALAGRAVFRHKTRKEPFSAQLYLIVAAQAALGAWLLTSHHGPFG